jgi:hypothetical protein
LERREQNQRKLASPVPEQGGDPQDGEAAPLSVTSAFWLIVLCGVVPWVLGFYGAIRWLERHL